MSNTIDFYFEISSPYSYMAATQIEEVAARAGAEVSWRPVVLGAVFKETGNDMPAKVAAKGRYMLGDLKRWARRYGVEFSWPSRFPMNTITAHRAILAAEARHDAQTARALTLAIYRAYWGEDRDVSSPEVLGEIIAAQGLDAEAILAATQDPEIKARLREYTDEAVARGVFGAPSFVIGDELFWGNDRLDFVEEVARGG